MKTKKLLIIVLLTMSTANAWAQNYKFSPGNTSSSEWLYKDVSQPHDDDKGYCGLMRAKVYMDDGNVRVTLMHTNLGAIVRNSEAAVFSPNSDGTKVAKAPSFIADCKKKYTSMIIPKEHLPAIGKKKTYTIKYFIHSGAACDNPGEGDPNHYYAFYDEFSIENVTSSQDEGDIYISSENASPTSVAPSETIDLSCRQYFNGSASQDYQIKVGYYLSTNSTYGSSDVFLGSDVSTIGSDSYDNEEETITIPANTSPGNYYILFYGDYTNNFAETNENNNVEYLPITVTATSPVSTIKYPNGGEEFLVNDNLSIKYTTNYNDNVTLQLINKNSELVHTFKSNTINNGSLYTSIPDVASGQYKVKIYRSGHSDAIDYSNNYFTIKKSNPSLKVTYPNGGEIFTVGDAMNIRYEKEDFTGKITLQLVKTSDLSVVETITSGTNSNGYYNWTIPQNLNAGNYKIKIYNSGSGSMVDYSDNYFTINRQGCSVTNPAPSTGEFYEACCYLMKNGILDTRQDVEPNLSIIRQDVAKIIYRALYQDIVSPASKFSTFFYDLLTKGEEYHQYAIALSYLEYGDGKSPFDRDFVNFNPGYTIQRKHYVKALLEAFNIKPDNSGNNPFTDVGQNDPFYPYMKKSYDLGITKHSEFRPHDNTTRIEAFLMLYRVLTNGQSINLPTKDQLKDKSNYFIPINYTKLNSGSSKGLLEGVFQSYSKNAFSLKDIGFSLDFGVFYNSYKYELPKELFLINSLSDGWSHNYDMQLIEIDGKGYMDFSYDNFEIYAKLRHRCLVMPDGSVIIFYEDDNKKIHPLTQGVNSSLKKDGNRYILTTKHKNIFTFEYKTENKYHDPVYMITTITDRNGNAVNIEYDTDKPNLIRTVRAESGRTLSFLYNNNDKITKIVDNSLARSIEIAYNNDNISQFKDANGKITKYEYDNTGNPHTQHLLKKVILPRGNSMTVEYEKRKVKALKTGNRIIKIDPQILDNKTIYTVSQAGKTIKTEVAFLNGSNPKQVDGMVSEVKGNGQNVKYEYNLNGKNPTLPSSATVNGVKIKTEYDDNRNLITRTIEEYGGITERFTYDPKYNLLTSYTDANNHTTVIKRNDKGNVETVTDAMGSTTTFDDYNNWGLPELITNPEGIQVKYTYNRYGNVEKIEAPLDISTTFTYDKGSRLKAVTVNGKTTKYDYDNADNLIKTTNALNYTTKYIYDDNYNLFEIINAKGNATRIEYDDYDLVKSVSFGGSVEKYSYYDDGAFKSFTKPSGQSLTNVYDDKGRLTSNGYIESATYFENGINANRLKTVKNQNGTLTYNYDKLSRLAYYTDYFGNKVEYKYDLVGNITKLIYPDNKTVTYSYNANNQLKTVTADWLNKAIVSYTYRKDGLLKTETTSSGIVTSYNYDDAGRLIDKEIKKSDNSTLQSWTYKWDLSGNITKEEAGNNLFDEYPQMDIKELQYSYNNENRISSISGEENINFTFDKDGNCLTKNNTNYSYDINDRLIGIKGENINASYEYDAFGMRRKATRNGTESRYVLDIAGMEDVIAETDASNNVKWYYIQGIGMAARISASGEIQYYHHDFRGSTVAITDDSENITHKYAYDEFGTVLQTEETDYNEFRYVGRYGVIYESEGLQFMRARFADNKIGRFLSEDPIWSTNLYPYANNNPVKFIDANGLSYTAILRDIKIAVMDEGLKMKGILGTAFFYKDLYNNHNNPNKVISISSGFFAGLAIGAIVVATAPVSVSATVVVGAGIVASAVGNYIVGSLTDNLIKEKKDIGVGAKRNKVDRKIRPKILSNPLNNALEQKTCSQKTPLQRRVLRPQDIYGQGSVTYPDDIIDWNNESGNGSW